MINFIEFHYANALFVYRRIDGYGERVSASAASIFYSLGFCAILINVIQNFTGSLAPFARQALGLPNKPYDTAAEFLLGVPFAFVLHYFWLWRRTPILEKRYAELDGNGKRWVALLGTLLSVAFVLICGYGRAHLLASLLLAASLLAAQELLFLALRKKFGV